MVTTQQIRLIMNFQWKARSAVLLLLSSLSVAFSANCTFDQSGGIVNCRGKGLTSIPALPSWSRSVDLSYNQITTVGTLKLPKLQVLDLSNNKIAEVVGEAVHSCGALKSLDLSFNSLRKCPQLLLPKPSLLTSLNLASNKLDYLMSNAFKKLANAPLATLNLSSTLQRTSGSPIDVQALAPFAKTLRTLDLSDNHLKASHIAKGLQPLRNSKLEQLLISGSFLESLDGVLQGLPSLSKLLVARSDLQTLSANTFKGCGKLTQLDLRSNSLKSLPASLFSSLKLKKVFLGDNPFACTCALAWMHAWLNEAAVGDKNNVKCASPLTLKNRKIVDWDVSGCFTSTPKPKTTTTRKPKTTTTHKPKTTTTHKPKTTTTHKPKTTTTHRPKTTTTHKPKTTTTHNPKTTTTHRPKTTTTHKPIPTTSHPKPGPTTSHPKPGPTTSGPHSSVAPPSGHPGDGRFPWWAALLIVIGVTLLALTLYVVIRRVRRRSRLDESLTPIVADDDDEVTTRRSFLC